MVARGSKPSFLRFSGFVYLVVAFIAPSWAWAQSSSLVIQAQPGFVVTYNGNDGDQFDAGAPPSGALAPANYGLASQGAVAFTSGDLGPELGVAFHVAANLNDGFYGNENCWIGSSAASPPFFAGLDLGTLRAFRSVAWSRDNGNNVSDSCGGQCRDRVLGLYTLQITTDPNVSELSSWTTVATFDFLGNDDDVVDGGFTSYFRHEFQVATDGGQPLSATGVRILVPASGLSSGTAIDEIEVHQNPISPPPPPPPPPFGLVAAPGFGAAWDGNDGDFFDGTAPPQGALVPDNLALSTNGAVAFSSGDLGDELGISFHRAFNVNDGFYGNVNSWMGATGAPAPFHVGVDLGGAFAIDRVAFGRDNGNNAADSCGGQCADRWVGQYQIQVTESPDPSELSAVWTAVASIAYIESEDEVVGGGFTAYLRHEFQLSTDMGNPIRATGVRLIVPGTGLFTSTCIDELEVYGTVALDAGHVTPPRKASIESVFPNPMNPRTSIAYRLERGGVIDLTILDARGRRVVTLTTGIVAEGRHTVTWNGVDWRGKRVGSGAYFVRLEHDGSVHSRKLVLVE